MSKDTCTDTFFFDQIIDQALNFLLCKKWVHSTTYLSISQCYSCVFIMYTSGNKRRRGKDKIAKVALYVSSCLPRPYSLYVPWVHTLESSNHVFCMEMVSKIHTRPDQLHVGKVCIDWKDWGWETQTPSSNNTSDATTKFWYPLGLGWTYNLKIYKKKIHHIYRWSLIL